MITRSTCQKALECRGQSQITYEIAFDWITGMPAQKRLDQRAMLWAAGGSDRSLQRTQAADEVEGASQVVGFCRGQDLDKRP